MREDARSKGLRYLTEGRLVVESIRPCHVEARCRGGGVTYRLGYSVSRWWCDCPCRTTCSHLVALQSVVDVGSDSE